MNIKPLKFTLPSGKQITDGRYISTNGLYKFERKDWTSRQLGKYQVYKYNPEFDSYQPAWVVGINTLKDIRTFLNT